MLSQFCLLTAFQKLSRTCPLGHSPTMLTGRLSLAADTMAEHIVAAPPMSALMRSIFAEGLMEIPPLWGERTSTILIAKKRTKATFLKMNTLAKGQPPHKSTIYLVKKIQISKLKI